MLYAQARTVGGVFQMFQKVLTSVIPVLIGAAVVIFLFGMLRYINAGDQPDARESGRQFMIFGIVALFVMVSLWGLVSVLSATFVLNNSPVSVPQF